MAWRGAVWLGFFLGSIVVLVVLLAGDTRQSYVFATAGALFVAGIVGTKTDAHFSGIARLARHHFGAGWHQLTEVTKPIPKREWFDIYQAMEALRVRQQMRPQFGVGGLSSSHAYFGDEDEMSHRGTFYQPGLVDLIGSNAKVEPLRHLTLSTVASRPLRVAENAMFLLRTEFILHDEDGQPLEPFACSLVAGKLLVAAKSEAIAQQAIRLIEQKSHETSIYRGHVLTCKPAGKQDYQIEFAQPAKVTREQLILPAQILEILDRNVLQVIKHADNLRHSRRNLQHGILLYGPPGTGKSLAIRYLTTAAAPITVINVTGRQLRLVRESCRLARVLAPSLVVLEDVDLIATDRAQNRRTMLLHDLLDEMDVACRELPVIFLMTTNRPHVIEQALALRPGRINQAIHFPLPDAECRFRLLQHFFQGVDSAKVDLQIMVDRSTGTSAAFIEEWVRRSILFAIERQAEPETRTTVIMDDVDAAMREIVEYGGALTKKLLGHSTENSTQAD